MHALAGSLTIIGSDKLSDLWIEDPTVSRRHAIVRQANGKVTITDLNSRQGTRINGAALVPEMASTLEPGDLVKLGEAVLGFHKTPPPPAPPRRPATLKKKAAPKPRPAVGTRISRRPAPPPPARRSMRASGKWVAIGLGILMVGCLGALVLILAGRDDAPESQVQPAEPASRARAAVDGLPQAGWATIAACPDLIETDNLFFCAKLEDYGAKEIELVGRDGRRHRFDAGLVQRITDRADLARRAREQIDRVAIGDRKACDELARWCFQRHIRGPLEPFLKRIVNLRPNDPLRELLEVIEKGKR